MPGMCSSSGIHGQVEHARDIYQFRLYFVIAAQIAQVAQPMLFKWTRELGNFGQQ